MVEFLTLKLIKALEENLELKDRIKKLEFENYILELHLSHYKRAYESNLKFEPFAGNWVTRIGKKEVNVERKVCHEINGTTPYCIITFKVNGRVYNDEAFWKFFERNYQ